MNITNDIQESSLPAPPRMRLYLMTIADQIYAEAQAVPDELAREVLDFILNESNDADIIPDQP